MNQTKIRLSIEEAELISNSNIILTKNRISTKVNQLLGQLASKQQTLSRKFLNPEVLQVAPKIARGENYLGLPWQLLDYPRVFGKEDVLAIRTMFWWGNFFSTTLHLAGRYHKAAIDNLIHHFEYFSNENYFICINADPWIHHFDPSNYKSIHQANLKEYKQNITQNSFVKIAAAIPLNEWDDAEQQLLKHFQYLIQIVK
ncbi:MAG TPA: hypothetical protein PK275_08170 [Chitinophagaceae bacterium]|jgi:hypothetical protein|nr:hypothetical protein [Chitinophagaceae bacterium]